MVRYSAGVSLASRTRSIIIIVRNLKLHLVTLPGANLASNELLLKLCKAYFALRQITDQAGVSLLIGLEEKTEKNVITKGSSPHPPTRTPAKRSRGARRGLLAS